MRQAFFVLTISFLCLISRAAYAVVFLDFEEPNFSREPAGDNIHDWTTNPILNTPDGKIEFNGRITNRLDGDPIPDHTLGTKRGSFLKNTSGIDGNPFLVF